MGDRRLGPLSVGLMISFPRCWADPCAGVELVRANIDTGSAVDGYGMAPGARSLAPLGVHPAGGFARGPGCDASLRKRQRGRHRVNDAGHAVFAGVISRRSWGWRPWWPRQRRSRSWWRWWPWTW